MRGHGPQVGELWWPRPCVLWREDVQLAVWRRVAGKMRVQKARARPRCRLPEAAIEAGGIPQRRPECDGADGRQRDGEVTDDGQHEGLAAGSCVEYKFLHDVVEDAAFAPPLEAMGTHPARLSVAAAIAGSVGRNPAP